ncbi:GNAT family N-acetyltransferase [Salipiger mangrovisoli]|uniref:N-acetyltransferase n=1 Tax=Salipiger mangrovisoli TaxID=2865933 RepID=A0ABR9X3L7_9RHOB|nr:N-acetyltransferase [Salipiger mangrovisoli]MBE9638101.1 N-acetyltransferase [Salipiger mangrovisoli]
MHIRTEGPEETEAISALTTHAFASATHAEGTEAAIVERLRAAGALTVSLVAEEEGALLGHVAVSPVEVAGHHGWQGLGPISVTPERQRSGIGTALMRAALAELRASHCKGVVLVGNPEFYRHFGFRQAPGLTVEGIPPEVVLALPFGPDLPEGALRFHPAFGLD